MLGEYWDTCIIGDAPTCPDDDWNVCAKTGIGNRIPTNLAGLIVSNKIMAVHHNYDWVIECCLLL